MKRLRNAGIPAYIALGNHDAANRMTTTLPWGENVRFFDHRKPERVLVPGCDVALYSQSFRSPHITEDLTSTFPLGDPGTFNVGVLHTSATGAHGHEPYAPCSIESLKSRHYQYWALGHVHRRAELAKEPWVVFSGNLQGRSVRECGPRGCYLVDVDDRSAVSMKFEPLDVVRWQVVGVEVNESTAFADLDTLAVSAIERAAVEADGRALAVRVVLEGRGSAFDRAISEVSKCTARIRSLAQDMPVAVHVERLELVPRSQEGRIEEDATGPVAELRALARSFASDPALLSELRAEFADLKMKLAAAVRIGDSCPDPQDEVLLRNALASVESLLSGRTQAKEGLQ
jgi:DNA repair exonuclease SbcCD nuclease subunit